MVQERKAADPRVARLLKQLRRAHDLTQEKLAAELGYSVHLVQSVESGARPPSQAFARRLATWLGVPDELAPLFEQWARGALPAAERGHLDPWLGEAPARAGRAVATNLPSPPTLLLGREAEVADAVEQLRRPGVRLLTLWGAPGIGKTRLAIQAAAALADDFPDGVCFVPLAPLADDTLVAGAIAAPLGVAEAGGQSADERLLAAMSGKQLLLLLDNFEHLLGAAPLVGRLLAAAAGLKVLVTSREPLRLYGEHEFEVPPLEVPWLHPLPPPAGLAENPAVALFVERARAVRPGFRLTEANGGAVAALCVGLDGLPLAIELAAARARELSPAEILGRLGQRLDVLADGPRDVPDRLRTLRAAIAWSHDLLAEGERVLFRRLGVFRGGFSPAAAQAVCAGPDDRGADVPSCLGSLTRKALVKAGALRRPRDRRGDDERFELLETIRAYSEEKLDASGEADALRRRHAAYVIARAEQVERELSRRHREETLDDLEREHANARAALQWLAEQAARGDADAATDGLRLGVALSRYLDLRGHWREGRAWLRRAVEHGGRAAPGWCAKALLEDGILAMRQAADAEAHVLLTESLSIFRGLGDRVGSGSALRSLAYLQKARGGHGEARAYLEEALSLARADDDRRALAHSLEALGYLLGDQGAYSEAAAYLDESVAIWRELGDSWGLSNALEFLGYLATSRGDFARALRLHEECLAHRRAVNDRWRIAVSLKTTGRALADLGDLEGARARLTESRRTMQELGDKRNAADAALGLAEVELREAEHSGKFEHARAAFEDVLALYRDVGHPWGIAEACRCLGYAECHLARPSPAAGHFRECLELCRGEGHARGVALALMGLGGVAALGGDAARGARLLASAQRRLEDLGAAMRPLDRAAFRSYETAVRRQLDQGALAAAWDAGRRMTPAQAVADAQSLNRPAP